MRSSKSKPPSFFARHVKSLVISSDVEAQLVVEILAVCRGLLNFSYWATPHLSVRRPSRGPSIEVAPQRMSVFLHEHHIHPLKPHFNLVFFSSLTHLSILNSWEDWTTWNYISSDALPALTHIKFDLHVQGSRPCNIGVPNFQNSESESRKNLGWNEESMTPESLWPDIKLPRVANTLTEVLNHNRTLRVCILLLRFDTDPTYTAKVIARLASQKLFRGRTPPKTDHDTCAPHWFDPRLVFAHEREPFRYSHAHSKHEMMLWKSAETIVNSQKPVRSMCGFFFVFSIGLINCYF